MNAIATHTGSFRLYVPRSLGGVEVDPVTYACAQEELARHGAATRGPFKQRARARGGARGSPTRQPRRFTPTDRTSCSRCRSPFRWLLFASWIWVTATSDDHPVDGLPEP